MHYQAKNINDGKYLIWLIEHVGGSLDDFSELFEYLLNKDFEWLLERDQNRAFDGIKLRDIYMKQGGSLNHKWSEKQCSVLEMLIGLSIRMETDITGEPDDDHPERWFWTMLKNLGIDDENDDNFDLNYVDRIIDIWLKRRFREDGFGSIFPLEHAENDQREIEIWNQMNNFLNENYI